MFYLRLGAWLIVGTIGLWILIVILEWFYSRTEVSGINEQLIPEPNECPICGRAFDDTRRPVAYHISYKPLRVIIACQICNEIEYLQRTGLLNKRIIKINSLKK